MPRRPRIHLPDAQIEPGPFNPEVIELGTNTSRQMEVVEEEK